MTRAFPFGLARFRFNEVRINEVPLYREHKYLLISKMKQYNEHNSEGLAHKRKLLYGNIGHAKLVLKRARKYYARNRARICANKRHRYNLSEPKPFAKHQYVVTSKKALLGDAVVRGNL